jgi:hypothetical protein
LKPGSPWNAAAPHATAADLQAVEVVENHAKNGFELFFPALLHESAEGSGIPLKRFFLVIHPNSIGLRYLDHAVQGSTLQQQFRGLIVKQA